MRVLVSLFSKFSTRVLVVLWVLLSWSCDSSATGEGELQEYKGSALNANGSVVQGASGADYFALSRSIYFGVRYSDDETTENIGNHIEIYRREENASDNDINAMNDMSWQVDSLFILSNSYYLPLVHTQKNGINWLSMREGSYLKAFVYSDENQWRQLWSMEDEDQNYSILCALAEDEWLLQQSSYTSDPPQAELYLRKGQNTEYLGRVDHGWLGALSCSVDKEVRSSGGQAVVYNAYGAHLIYKKDGRDTLLSFTDGDSLLPLSGITQRGTDVRRDGDQWELRYLAVSSVSVDQLLFNRLLYNEESQALELVELETDATPQIVIDHKMGRNTVSAIDIPDASPNAEYPYVGSDALVFASVRWSEEDDYKAVLLYTNVTKAPELKVYHSDEEAWYTYILADEFAGFFTQNAWLHKDGTLHLIFNSNDIIEDNYYEYGSYYDLPEDSYLIEVSGQVSSADAESEFWQVDTLESFSVEERYKELEKERPDLLQRLPQSTIASILGITPVSLSRIRARLTQATRSPDGAPHE
jgi:hypothetical protein